MLVRHHILVIDLLPVLLLPGKKLRSDFAHMGSAIDYLLLFEHERILDVALFDVLSQQVEVI
jgi:hypothetical protein